MERIKNYTIIVLFTIIVILLSLRQCTPSKPKESTIERTETIKWDTIKSPAKIIEGKTKYYPKWDTVEKTDTTWNASLCDFTRTYNDSTSDSNITIYTHQKVIGLLESSKVDYRLKIPQKIIERHEIHDTKAVPNKWDIIAIGGIGGNKAKFNMSAGLALKYKKVYYGYEYNFIDQTHNAKVGIILFNSKK